MGKTIDFFAEKNQLKKGFPGACFLRCGIFNGSFDTKKRSLFAILVAVFAPGKLVAFKCRVTLR